MTYNANKIINRIQTKFTIFLKKNYLQKSAIFSDIVVYLNDLWTGQELHNKTWSDNRRDSQLHDCSTAGCKDGTHPVKRICPRCRMYPIKWELTTYKKDEKWDNCVYHFLSERNLPVSTLNFRQKCQKWPNKMQHPESSACHSS